ncbi:MAG: serine/threonine-protein kinase [Nakamurella sp.]
MTTMRLLAGRYRLDTEIGRGSMGTVWDAYDETLRRRVAIKEVNFPAGIPMAEIDILADRTLREARAIAALSHPHVITLFDILMLPDGPVIVMELMIARSLADILQSNGPLSVRDAAVIGQAVASGLVAAHGAGITHRDVKPANVLISDDGQIKLTDFGIARAAGEQTLTATGMLLGSPAYISPEVASGRPATPSADAWGLGALLFAMLEGRPPFDRGKPIETMTAVVSEPAPPHPHSGMLGPVIDGLLTKDPGLRMPMDTAEAALTEVARGAYFLPPSAPSVTTAPALLDSGTVSDSGPGTTSASSLSLPPAGPAMAPLLPPTLRPPTLPRPNLHSPSFQPPSGQSASWQSASLPPPPWSAAAAATLARLPTVASEHPRRRAGWAAVVLIVAAAMGFVAVIAIASFS